MEHPTFAPAPQPSGWNHIRRILVPTDFSDRADKALRYALDLARQFHAEIHLLHVIPPLEGDAYSPLRYAPEAIAAHDTPDKIIYDLLASTITRHAPGDVWVEPVTQRALRIAPAILDYASRARVDLIVITTHGARGMKQFFLGSVAAEVVHRAPCNALIVQERASEPRRLFDFRRVLVPVDFSTASLPLLRQARHLAAFYDAGIDLLHIVESPSFLAPLAGVATLYDLVPNLLEQAQNRMQHLLERSEGPDVSIHPHVLEGRPPVAIIDFAEEHGTDLIVIATRGLSGVVHFLMGSTTERVVRAAPCPVLTVQTPVADTNASDPVAAAEAE